MERIPDDLLLEAYEKAKELKLEKDFIALIKQEISRRNLTNNIKASG